jgi:hypothetical protein
MRRSFLIVLALSALLGSTQVTLAQSTGTLTFAMQAFTSEIDLRPKVEAQLKSGGLEWGVQEQQLIVTLVNKRFINAEIPNLTRYGESKDIELPAGNYTLTCIGLVPEGGLSVDKVLNKGAYFNNDVLRFTIEPGKTTVLDVASVIRKENTFFLKFFVPEITVRVLTDGVANDAVAINIRDDRSVAWADYAGPLKFVAQ